MTRFDLSKGATLVSAKGPLKGFRIVEFAGLGPAPFACMLLSDMGAEVITIDREDAKPNTASNVVGRGRKIVPVDLKDPVNIEKLKNLIKHADVVIEGYRPGVMERLDLGPEVLLALNPKLVYGRMTGWGQDGPLAQSAGHDINYISLTGALHAIGAKGGAPIPPLNLVGDYAGGSMYLLVGILAALLESKQSGRGQVVDAAIADGAISLMSHFFGCLANNDLKLERASNMLDGGYPFYRVYETADQKHISFGALEPKFFEDFANRVGLADFYRKAHARKEDWLDLEQELERIFKSKTRDEWGQLFAGTDACVAPILNLTEAASHPHILSRQAIIQNAGVAQPAPAPRFSRTPSVIQTQGTQEIYELDQLNTLWAYQ